MVAQRLREARTAKNYTYGEMLLCGPSIGFLVLWYVLATVGEVLISPLGLELASALVPRRHAATATALWLASMALGGWLAGQLGGLSDLRLAVYVLCRSVEDAVAQIKAFIRTAP